MRQPSRRTATILLALCLALAGCKQAAEEQTSGADSGGATVTSLDGTGVKQVTLTPEAAGRLAIRTVPVRRQRVASPSGGPASKPRTVAPYAAVVYDVNGAAWVYTMPRPLTYVRQRVSVDYVDRDLAVLTAGPAVGTAIVTEGVAELYGTEIGVGISE